MPELKPGDRVRVKESARGTMADYLIGQPGVVAQPSPMSAELLLNVRVDIEGYGIRRFREEDLEVR